MRTLGPLVRAGEDAGGVVICVAVKGRAVMVAVVVVVPARGCAGKGEQRAVSAEVVGEDKRGDKGGLDGVRPRESIVQCHSDGR